MPTNGVISLLPSPADLAHVLRAGVRSTESLRGHFAALTKEARDLLDPLSEAAEEKPEQPLEGDEIEAQIYAWPHDADADDGG